MMASERDQIAALIEEIESWSPGEQAEVSDALRAPADQRAVVFATTVDAIRRRHAASAPLPQDALALAIRARLSPSEVVRMAHNLVAEVMSNSSASETDRRAAQALLDDLRRRGFPMEDA